MAPQFVDISAWQPTNIDWQVYKQWSVSGDGVSRVAMRSSYGVGYTDQHFAAYRAGALAAGIDSILFYHYSYPSLNNPVDEAKWQHSVVGAVRAQDMLILDFEEGVPQATSDWAYAWLAQQEDSYDGKLPGLYASSAFIQQRLNDPRLAKYPLWLANWQFTPDERPPVPYPWTDYEFVQYTDKAINIPGIAGTVDANIFLGKIQPEEQPMTIDLTNGTVASHFTGDDTIWSCKDNGFLVGHAILDFYRSFGGNALCGLTHLGLPSSNELPVHGYPGVTQQEFERGCVRYDPSHLTDNPPASGPVYVIHTNQDPRWLAAQAQITTLQGEIAALPVVANMKQIQTIGQTIKDDVDLIMKLAQVQ